MAATKLGTIAIVAVALWSAMRALADGAYTEATGWSAVALVAITAVGLWWRLMPTEPAPSDRAWAGLLAALARGEVSAFRARTQQWRAAELERLDPSAFRQVSGRLYLFRSPFARWCADWSWYAPSAPDILISGAPPVPQERPSSAGPAARPAGPASPARKVERRRSRADAAPRPEPTLPLFPALAGEANKDTPVSKTPDPPKASGSGPAPGKASARGADAAATTREAQDAAQPGAARPEATGELISIKDVAHMLRCSRSTLYRLAANGGFPEPVRVGSSVRYRRADILAWIERQPSR
ncbi:MAG: helix-turn-helix domain-containing protein [Sphingomonadaceae bacterium]